MKRRRLDNEGALISGQCKYLHICRNVISSLFEGLDLNAGLICGFCMKLWLECGKQVSVERRRHIGRSSSRSFSYPDRISRVARGGHTGSSRQGNGCVNET